MSGRLHPAAAIRRSRRESRGWPLHVRLWATTTVCLVRAGRKVAAGVTHAQVSIAGVVVVEVPIRVRVDGFVAAGAGGFAGADERGDGGAASLVCVAPADTDL